MNSCLAPVGAHRQLPEKAQPSHVVLCLSRCRRGAWLARLPKLNHAPTHGLPVTSGAFRCSTLPACPNAGRRRCACSSSPRGCRARSVTAKSWRVPRMGSTRRPPARRCICPSAPAYIGPSVARRTTPAVTSQPGWRCSWRFGPHPGARPSLPWCWMRVMVVPVSCAPWSNAVCYTSVRYGCPRLWRTFACRGAARGCRASGNRPPFGASSTPDCRATGTPLRASYGTVPAPATHPRDGAHRPPPRYTCRCPMSGVSTARRSQGAAPGYIRKQQYWYTVVPARS
jgi:hypothetical protein